jgi:ribonuclease D
MAVDTEFVGEDHYVPRLELIQIAFDELAVVLDFPALTGSPSLRDFWTILLDPGIEKIFHAGRQDLELFVTHAGHIPKPFFDTQIAAAMVGYGAQTAYAHLVQRVHGTRLAKAHTFTNWSQRPLTPEQLDYALEDVQYLLPVYDHLRARLHRLERLEWVAEEFARLESAVGEPMRAPQDRYKKIRGWDSLKPGTVAILRELAEWREREAHRRNVPRGRVMRDEVLLQLARHPPKTLQALRTTRGLHPSEADRNGDLLLAVIHRALALPASAWPEVPREKKPEPESTGLVELLQAVLKTCAASHHVAASLLATTADLQALVEAKGQRESLDLPILRGWRRVLAGEHLLAVLSGRMQISVDPQTQQVTCLPVARS